MPSSYRKLGIAFQYPDNWELDEGDALEGNQSVTVYSPGGGAFWSVSAHPAGVRPDDLAEAAVQAMREEYDSVESEVVSETVADVEMSGYDLYFYCFDLTSTAAIRIVQTPEATLAVFYQAEDRELAQVEPVFRAMLVSLLRELEDGRRS